MINARRARTWMLISVLFGLAFSPSCGTDLAQPAVDAGIPLSDGAVADAGPDASDATLIDANLSECERSAADHSVAGCEYLVFSPHVHNEAFACTAVVLSNLSSADATIELEFQNAKLDATKYIRLISGSGKNISYDVVSQPTIPPGRSAIVSAFQGKVAGIGPGEECPSLAVGSVMAPAGALADGLWIRSTVPVSAFFDFPYGDPSSNIEGATALRSTASWDTRYRDVGIYKPGRPDKQEGGTSTEPGWTTLTGGTTTTVTLASDAGPKQLVLTRGRVFTAMQDDGFIGTLITGTQPFGAWVYSQTLIPWNWLNADYTYLQFASTDDWGWEYAAVRYPSRYSPTDKTSIWRMVGDVAGTVLTYDPAPPPGAPTTLSAGQLVIFRTGDPFVVRSQDANHRFYLMQLMTGWSDGLGVQNPEAPADGGWSVDGGYPAGAYGDPEAQGTPPPHEYSKHFVFFTQPTYPTTKLVFIRHKGPSGFHDVTLDCAGTLTGWQAIGGSDYEWVYVALSDGNFVPQVYQGGTCDNGNHVADSDGAFSIAVWAWPTVPQDGNEGPYATSYGYLVPGRTVSPRAMGDGGLLPN